MTAEVEKSEMAPRPLLAGARDVFSISIERTLPRARSLWALVPLAFPILLGLRMRFGGMKAGPLSGFEIYGMVVSLFHVKMILPLIALLFGSALISDAVESKTLTYYFTRPLTRFSIFLGEFLSYFVTVLTLALPCIVLTYLVFCAGTKSGLGHGAPELARDLLAATLLLLTYGAVFALMGVVLKRPLVPGLVFLFGSELLSNLPGDLPNYSVAAYARSLLKHRPPQEDLAALFAKFFSVSESIAVLSIVTIVALGVAAWIFSRREYVI